MICPTIDHRWPSRKSVDARGASPTDQRATPGGRVAGRLRRSDDESDDARGTRRGGSASATAFQGDSSCREPRSGATAQHWLAAPRLTREACANGERSPQECAQARSRARARLGVSPWRRPATTTPPARPTRVSRQKHGHTRRARRSAGRRRRQSQSLRRRLSSSQRMRVAQPTSSSALMPAVMKRAHVLGQTSICVGVPAASRT
jgi:hypothetical protein